MFCDVNFSISSETFDELVEEVLIGVYFEVHRAAKHTKCLFVDESPTLEHEKYAIIDKKGLDIFGELPIKKQMECVCPNCHRNLAASRFAPHLEKCMGMGRNSSRIASKRIATSSVKNNDSDDDYDNNGDTDWNVYCGDQKKTRRKRLKNANGIGNGNSVHKKVNNSKANKSGLNTK
ncbi:unnamed protein product [Medioppia subpectinata]|uniref:SAGA-associated factor 11 homolog n=1 Tax=Medioppia subpectinata TaxID=1979941 RepID=A0A7R9PU37_9ACAR|nr:unnamed protein product [Medioppia subpectinata]CAG2100374.1 unnamed protein product [Medioppia subpectinata]